MGNELSLIFELLGGLYSPYEPICNWNEGRLTYLYLYNNELTGELPVEMSNLVNLVHLYLLYLFLKVERLSTF